MFGVEFFDGYVFCDYFWIIDDDQVVGFFFFCCEFNDYLCWFGGYIGYFVILFC